MALKTVGFKVHYHDNAYRDTEVPFVRSYHKDHDYRTLGERTNSDWFMLKRKKKYFLRLFL